MIMSCEKAVMGHDEDLSSLPQSYKLLSDLLYSTSDFFVNISLYCFHILRCVARSVSEHLAAICSL